MVSQLWSEEPWYEPRDSRREERESAWDTERSRYEWGGYYPENDFGSYERENRSMRPREEEYDRYEDQVGQRGFSNDYDSYEPQRRQRFERDYESDNYYNRNTTPQRRQATQQPQWRSGRGSGSPQRR